MTGCSCQQPGLCARHGVHKNAHWHHLCQTNDAYFAAWEQGRGPGQKAPMAARNPKTVVRTNSSIGDILARRFERLGIVPVPGCPCKQVQTMLNAMSPSAVMSDLDGWATRLQRSARKWKELKGGMWNFIPSPPLWLCKRVIEDAAKEAQGLKSADEDTAL